MTTFTLFVGTKNLSSWSLRAWLIMKHAGIEFNTVVVELYKENTEEKLAKISPSKKVPLLQHNNHLIWDSLAIAEYIAELFPQKHLWPSNPIARSLARSISCEMHSGFLDLRKNLPMNINKKFKDHIISTEAGFDIERILQIWKTYLKPESSFLFGDFTIADAMFAPVATRFRTYNVKLPPFAEKYVDTILSIPAMQEWHLDAIAIKDKV